MNQRTLILAIAVVAVVAGVLLFTLDGGGPSGSQEAGLRLDEQPRKGPADAAVQVVVFEDFLCSHCGTFSQSVFPRLERAYEGDDDVALYTMNFVVIGPESRQIAAIGECVAEQGSDAFYAFEEVAFRSQSSLTPAVADDLARRYATGLDETAFDACVASDRGLVAADADTQAATDLGLRGTPSVLVNGTPVASPGFDQIQAAVDAARP
jgi:protein-disulfide isomerase